MIAGTKIYFDKVEKSIPALIEGSNNLKENYETFNGKSGNWQRCSRNVDPDG